MNACILFAKHKLFKKNIKQETVDKNYPLFRIKLFSISYLNNIEQFFFGFKWNTCYFKRIHLAYKNFLSG